MVYPFEISGWFCICIKFISVMNGPGGIFSTIESQNAIFTFTKVRASLQGKVEKNVKMTFCQ